VSKGSFARFNLGNDIGDDPVAVAENRRRLRTLAGLPAEPNWLKQVHGVSVADLDALRLSDQAKSGDPAKPTEADAAITRSPGHVCAILTADCLPVVFATASGDAVAAAHAGWRGLSAGVIRATVEALGGAPEHLLAWLGPAIGPKHFEVGAEVRAAFLDADPESRAAFQLNARGRFMADLAELARSQLKKLGVTRIYGGTECTFERPDRYFSYRRDGVTGRQATLIWREA
jgi:YfiH family protein